MTSEGQIRGLAVEFADVDGEGGEGHGVEVLRAHCLVGAQKGEEKRSAQVEAVDGGGEREPQRRGREVAGDDDRRGGAGVRGRANDPDQSVLRVEVEEGDGAVADGGVAVVEGAELADPIGEGWS